jgi:flagellar protein FliT
MIRPAMTVWRDVTEKMLALMANEVPEEQRDAIIQGIEGFLNDRDKLQSQIIAPFTAEEEAFGKELIAMEADVQKKLALFMKQIRVDISESQSKKDHMKNYINPYSNVARDGTFYDTKQ